MYKEIKGRVGGGGEIWKISTLGYFFKVNLVQMDCAKLDDL